MSDRRFDVTGLQVMASVLATLTGAVAASYLGVAGTIIGAAVMSVASTAGSAIYKHYLGRTARRLKKLKEAAPDVAHKAAERMSAAGVHTTVPHRGRAHASGGEAPTVVDATVQHPAHADGSATATPAASAVSGDTAGPTLPGYRSPGEEPAHTAAGGEPHQQDDAATEVYHRPGRRPARSGWLRRRPGWLLAAVATLGIFAGVIGGITVFELAAGKPLDAVVWHRTGSGTTLGGVVGGQSPHSTAPAAPKPSSPAPSSPSPTGTGTTSPSPSPTPSSGSPSPTPTGGSPSPTPTLSTTPATTPSP